MSGACWSARVSRVGGAAGDGGSGARRSAARGSQAGAAQPEAADQQRGQRERRAEAACRPGTRSTASSAIPKPCASTSTSRNTRIADREHRQRDARARAQQLRAARRQAQEDREPGQAPSSTVSAKDIASLGSPPAARPREGSRADQDLGAMPCLAVLLALISPRLALFARRSSSATSSSRAPTTAGWCTADRLLRPTPGRRSPTRGGGRRASTACTGSSGSSWCLPSSRPRGRTWAAIGACARSASSSSKRASGSSSWSPSSSRRRRAGSGRSAGGGASARAIAAALPCSRTKASAVSSIRSRARGVSSSRGASRRSAMRSTRARPSNSSRSTSGRRRSGGPRRDRAGLRPASPLRASAQEPRQLRRRRRRGRAPRVRLRAARARAARRPGPVPRVGDQRAAHAVERGW